MSKVALWTLVGFGVLILLMIIMTVYPQTDQLQTRVERGIGSTADEPLE